MSDFLSMSVEQVLALPEAQAAEVLAAWVKAKRPTLPEAVARAGSKVHARLAKKALYQLKSGGVAVAEPEAPKAEATAAPAAPLAEELPGVISPMLGTGDRAIFFARPMRGGGVEVVQGILNDELGITLLERGESNRGTFRRRIKELESHADLKVLFVDWARMKLELGRGLALCERTRTQLSADADTALRRFGVQPVDPDFPVPAPEGGDDAVALNAASLAKEPELAQWLPPDTLLAQLVKEAEGLADSALALTDAQKHERLAAKAQALAKGFLTPEMGRTYGRRLWLMAELFDASQRPQPAALARAEGRRLFHGTGESRFVDALFQRAVELSQKPEPAEAPAPSGGASPPPRLSRP